MKKRIEQLKKIFWESFDCMGKTTNMKDWAEYNENVMWIDSELRERCENLIFEMYNKAFK